MLPFGEPFKRYPSKVTVFREQGDRTLTEPVCLSEQVQAVYVCGT
jgi:hypothetical protein